MMEPLLGGGKGDKDGGEAHPLASPWALGSLALLVQSFVIGAVDGIYGVPLTYYMYDVLDISGDNKYLYNIALSLPECVRILLVAPVFFFPYTFPRVKVFWVLSLLVFCSHYVFLATTSTLTMQSFMVYGFIGKLGENVFSGILAMEYVQRTKLESLQERGKLIVICNLANYLGTMLGYVLDYLFYENAFDWDIHTLTVKSICWIVAIAPLVIILPFIYLYEEQPSPPQPVFSVARDLFGAVSSPDLMLPFMIIMIGDILDISNGATDSLLLDGCDISAKHYTIWKLFRQVLLTAGVGAYLRLAFKWDFVTVVVATTVFYQFCQANLTWLVYNGGDNELYDDPDNCLTYYGVLVGGAETVMELNDMAKEVIKGILTVSRAGRSSLVNVLFSSVDSTFQLINSIISDELYEIWPASSSAIEKGIFDGWWRLQILSSLGPVAFQVLSSLGLPRSREEQAEAATVSGTDVVGKGSEGSSAIVDGKFLTGRWWCGISIILIWLFYVCFAYWWTFHDDHAGKELYWQPNTSAYSSKDAFIFAVLLLSYIASGLVSLAVGAGLVNWLKQPPSDV